MSKDDGDTEQEQAVRVLKSLWEPHPGQRAIMNHDARYRVVACGRRWGKSEMCAHIALKYALENAGATVWWVAPTYDAANDYGFDNVKPLVSPDVLADEPKLTKPRQFEFVHGSTISFRSADREDSLRGGGVDLLIIDESASVPERAWTEELRPTLSDSQGDAVFIGTPKGRNWFYRWYQRGQSEDHPDVASWSAPTYQNPHVLDSEVDAAKNDMPERAFDQEYRAVFLDESGGVFTDLRERNVADYDLADTTGDAPYSIGVDFARHQDWTVITVLDANDTLVAFERMQQVTWSRIQNAVERVAGEYSPSQVAVDATRDNKIVRDLANAGISVEAVSFSGGKKQTLIENLITVQESGELTIPAEANQLINEMEVFEFQMSESGRVSYSAPSNFHDDCVDSLALANHSPSGRRRRERPDHHGVRTLG